MQKIKVSPVVSGISIAKAYVLEKVLSTGNRTYIEQSQIEAQFSLLQNTIEKAVSVIKSLQTKAYDEGETEQGDVFEGYLEIVQDEELTNDIHSCIKNKNVDLLTAFSDVCADYAADMAALDDPYMQARADDFRQIFGILAEVLVGKTTAVCEYNCILISNEVGPADMAKIDKKYLKGIVVKNGSRTSHAAIICRSMEIPMLSGISVEDLNIKSGDLLIVDADEGFVIINPDEQTESNYRKKIDEQNERKNIILQFIDKEAVTSNGVKCQLMANIGTLEELDAVISNNADGVGLFRTEFLFMEKGGKEIPSEEEQFISYKTALEKLNGKPVIFRTLDAGGDKNISALGIPKEDNPFLGLRAIRYCLKNPEVFRIQLRALIRAAEYGNCKIMIPMITCENEIIQAKKLITSVCEELLENGITLTKKIPLGMMVETPSVAVCPEIFAKHVDFFSIGTNDLTQYTCAVDRGNEYVAELYDELNPAVVTLITNVIKTASKYGIDVHMCGEMAGDIKCTQTLLKAGLREFSLSANLIPKLKQHLSTLEI